MKPLSIPNSVSLTSLLSICRLVNSILLLRNPYSKLIKIFLKFFLRDLLVLRKVNNLLEFLISINKSLLNIRLSFFKKNLLFFNCNDPMLSLTNFVLLKFIFPLRILKLIFAL